MWKKTEYLYDWNSGRASLETFEHNSSYDVIYYITFMILWKINHTW